MKGWCCKGAYPPRIKTQDLPDLLDTGDVVYGFGGVGLVTGLSGVTGWGTLCLRVNKRKTGEWHLSCRRQPYCKVLSLLNIQAC